MIYFRLYLSFLLIGALTIGGGYAALPLIQEQAVNTHGWLTAAEFADLLSISEITPGPIAINSATFVGTKTAGVLGAVCATLGFMTVPFIITSFFYILYKKYRKLDLMQGILAGVRPAVTALIASAALTILVLALWGEGDVSLASIDIAAVILFLAGAAILRKWKLNPVFIILGCGFAGLIIELIAPLK